MQHMDVGLESLSYRLMTVLAQFLLRLSFGLAVGMGVTSPRQVTSGYFRNHLFVTLGLATLAALVLAQFSGWGMGFAIAAAVLSYAGSVAWLYEARRAGVVILWLVAASSLVAALVSEGDSRVASSLGAASAGLGDSFSSELPMLAAAMRPVSVVFSGLVLGTTIAAMLLGHWYLNAPGMELAPLRRLLVAMTLAVGLQMLVSALGLAAEWRIGLDRSSMWLMLLLMRWFWLLSVLPLVWMTWKTLEIPNTQSATGLLYVAVIGVFVGELAALLLSAESTFPL